jgi:hypothetical protein
MPQDLLALGRRRLVDARQLALWHEHLVLGQQRREDEAAEHEPLRLRHGVARRQQVHAARRRLHVDGEALAVAQDVVPAV